MGTEETPSGRGRGGARGGFSQRGRGRGANSAPSFSHTDSSYSGYDTTGDGGYGGSSRGRGGSFRAASRGRGGAYGGAPRGGRGSFGGASRGRGGSYGGSGTGGGYATEEQYSQEGSGWETTGYQEESGALGMSRDSLRTMLK